MAIDIPEICRRFPNSADETGWCSPCGTAGTLYRYPISGGGAQIKVFCPLCGRRMSNPVRFEYLSSAGVDPGSLPIFTEPNRAPRHYWETRPDCLTCGGVGTLAMMGSDPVWACDGCGEFLASIDRALYSATGTRGIEELPTIRSIQLRTMDYAAYLQTPEWRSFREAVLRVSEMRCVGCHLEPDNPSDLDVHHIRYPARGTERIGDVVLLCRACHNDVETRRKARKCSPE